MTRPRIELGASGYRKRMHALTTSHGGFITTIRLYYYFTTILLFYDYGRFNIEVNWYLLKNCILYSTDAILCGTRDALKDSFPYVMTSRLEGQEYRGAKKIAAYEPVGS